MHSATRTSPGAGTSSDIRTPTHGGVGQNLERRNVERSIFQNFKIANIKMTKLKFDSFIVEFIVFIFYKLFE